jgi:hypothetical protein
VNRARAACLLAGGLWLPLGAAACQEKEKPTAIAVERATWAVVRTEILAQSCTFAACHGSAVPAAALDLSAATACADLKTQPSCLFPGKALVQPGKPAESFFLAKLTGEGTSGPPEVACGTGTNARMPFGAPKLPAALIATVEAWIAAGAECEAAAGDDAGATGPAADAGDGGAGGDTDGGAGAAATEVASVGPQQLAVVTGQRGNFDVTLSRAAPAAGTVVTLQIDDGTIAGVPATVVVPGGQSSLAVMVVGKRPGTARVVARVPGGAAAAALSVRVTGLVLSEVLPVAAGTPAGPAWLELANFGDAAIDLGDYAAAAGVQGAAPLTTPLAGLLPPGGCVVVGGPAPAAAGGPRLDIVWDLASVFSLAREPGRAFSVAVYDKARPAGPTVLPIDAVAFGGAGDAGLLGPAGAPLMSAAGLPGPGRSLAQGASASWREQEPPTPGVCPRP